MYPPRRPHSPMMPCGTSPPAARVSTARDNGGRSHKWQRCKPKWGGREWGLTLLVEWKETTSKPS
eukprot:1625838-Rhodomonas_salina.1